MQVMVFIQTFVFYVYFVILPVVNGQTCTCDLLLGVCEVDCCCDLDCSEEERLLFNFCSNLAFDVTNNLCIVNQVVFSNNFELARYFTQNDLYCVVENTFQDRNNYARPTCIVDNTCFSNIDIQFTYNNATPASLLGSTMNTFYLSGDGIIALLDSNVETFLSTPVGYGSSDCNTFSPVRYLFSRTETCSRTLNITSACVAGSVFDFQSYFQGIALYATPNRTNVIPINVENCTDGNANIPCDIPMYNAPSCQNAVTSVMFNIITDGYSGITAASISFLLQNIRENNFPFTQTFTVSFRTLQNSGVAVLERSGMPGYLIGKPLVVAANRSTGVDKNPNIFLINPQVSGMCTQTQDRLPILFGQDQVTGCLVNVVSNCSAMQQSIKAILDYSIFDTPDTTGIYIGMFGNSNSTNLPTEFIQLLPGAFSASSNKSLGGCDGMVLSSRYMILYANTGSIASPQPKIVAVQHNYGLPQPLLFLCAPSSSTCNQVVEISTSVNFIDISETPVSLQTSIPTKEEQFPINFFFPLKNVAQLSRSFTYFLTLSCSTIIYFLLNSQ